MEEQEDYFNVIITKRSMGNSELIFECCANRGFVEIDQIIWKGSAGEPHIVKIREIEEEGLPSSSCSHSFSDPLSLWFILILIFISLSSNDPSDFDLGQEAFYDYLEERGIDNNFTKAVFLALDLYDQNEFRSWLRGIREFVEA